MYINTGIWHSCKAVTSIVCAEISIHYKDCPAILNCRGQTNKKRIHEVWLQNAKGRWYNLASTIDKKL